MKLRRSVFASLLVFLTASLLPAAQTAAGPTEEEVQRITAAALEKPTAPPLQPRKLLLFNRNEGFPHTSIPYGAKAVEILGQKTGAFEVVVSDDLQDPHTGQVPHPDPFVPISWVHRLGEGRVFFCSLGHVHDLPVQNVAFQWRLRPGASAECTLAATGQPLPYWVKLSRRGNLFTGYLSPDGQAWQKVGEKEVPMVKDVWVGLAVTSHNNAATTEAVLDGVAVTQGP